MLLHASSAAYHPLFLVPARTGDRGGAPPRLHAAKLQTLNGLQLRSSFSALSCSCSPSPSPGDGGKRSARSLFDELSVLSPVVPWEVDDIWRIYAGYFFILHIPLSFGGLGVIAKVMQRSSLDSMTTDAYDPVLKEILSGSPASALVCFFLYCVIAPLSEETIYRGFLLTALSSSMKWRDAVVISSLAFTVAHLSGKSSIQLFVVGCITGLAYCRTGTLAASFTIHSLYNAVLLYTALIS
uniref:CAAX prenyl protease 2/Lysostaphin resistance protein A-like domain-containing protein n=1 Tax=Zea mays TaxID=4577 RepID=A0A804Q8X5_MAIZE